MAGANQRFSSVSMESELGKVRDEEVEVKEVHHVEEEEDDAVRKEEESDETEEEDDDEDEEKEEEDENEGNEDDDEEEDNEEEEDEEDDYEDEEDKLRKGEDTCDYEDYKLVEDVSEDAFAEDDPEEYRIYLRFAIKTEGFYVPFAPKEAIGVATPIDPRSPWWPRVIEGAELAVAHYNKNRAGPDGQLKLVIIQFVTTRSVCGMLFYLTLGCQHVTSGEMSDYQAKLWRGYKGNWEVLIFRKEPDIVAEMIERYKEMLDPYFPDEESR